MKSTNLHLFCRLLMMTAIKLLKFCQHFLTGHRWISTDMQWPTLLYIENKYLNYVLYWGGGGFCCAIVRRSIFHLYDGGFNPYFQKEFLNASLKLRRFFRVFRFSPRQGWQGRFRKTNLPLSYILLAEFCDHNFISVTVELQSSLLFSSQLLCTYLRLLSKFREPSLQA